jgi:8-oxo-dGTP pyrophosphatase MutT (NUDIX family)
VTRNRATAIVTRDEKILLVRDRGRPTYALPGGGIEDDEAPESAVVRELLEETTLKAVAVTHLFRFPGKYNDHEVFHVEAEGDVQISEEIEGFTWWDGIDETPVYPHVKGILDRWRESAR